MIDATSLGSMALCRLEASITFDLAIYKDEMSMFRLVNHILQMSRASMTRPHEDLKVCYCVSRCCDLLIIFCLNLLRGRLLGCYCRLFVKCFVKMEKPYLSRTVGSPITLKCIVCYFLCFTMARITANMSLKLMILPRSEQVTFGRFTFGRYLASSYVTSDSGYQR